MSISFTASNGSLTLVLDGNVVELSKDHVAYRRVRKLLKEGAEACEFLEALKTVEAEVKVRANLDVAAYVDAYDEAEYVDGDIFINGEKVHQAIANRVAEFIELDLPFEQLLRFVERVELNPSYNSRQELYAFLENKGLPITDDGCFLAYKAVRNDYMDKYTGTIDNSPGCLVEMDRSKVDDNCSRHCSKGLHCGALDYIGWYGNAGDQIVIVKVDPENVVSVPTDSNRQKCRVCEYEVLRDFEGELNTPLYAADGEDTYGTDEDDYQDDWNWLYDDQDDDDRDKEDDDDDFDEGDVVSTHIPKCGCYGR